MEKFGNHHTCDRGVWTVDEGEQDWAVQMPYYMLFHLCALLPSCWIAEIKQDLAMIVAVSWCWAWLPAVKSNTISYGPTPVCTGNQTSAVSPLGIGSAAVASLGKLLGSLKLNPVLHCSILFSVVYGADVFN